MPGVARPRRSVRSALALGLQSRGYDITLMSYRTADEIRSGRVMSTQVMFHTALQHERDLALNFWESQAPRIEGLGISVAAPDAAGGTAGGTAGGAAGRAVDWLGRLDRYAQSVDQRVKLAGWAETFARRGGRLVIHGASVTDLDFFASRYDLTLVAAGKGEVASLIARDPARSPYDAPQRALAGRFTPVVRDPVGRLPSGGLVLGVADTVVTNDPVTGQGANAAAKCAASYLASIVEHGERPFDEAWMRSAFDRYWETARHVTKWTNAMLAPPPHVLNLIGAAGRAQPVADRIANGFDDPADFEDFFYAPDKADAYLASLVG
ncbi:hypothetical protein [Streptomyces sp. MST-110588]|uniref:hypothetical protein n=1 Tax=Streptomyces sp. MST-110588 TaxID=2833628 RepID=UPI001F5C5BCB|nr:hypothetical protein [Streptomyces sp. MST-110588]UNO39950.1 hypothetical protein KGS77_10515 [Streptomyces sp. MST-110588]